MPDGSPPPATCARDGCNERFTPRNRASRFCSTKCREKANARAQRATPEGQRTQAIRYAVWYEANASYQCWTAVLRRNPVLRTPQRLAVVETLRGKGHVEPEAVRALFTAAGCPWPDAVRTPPSRRRVEAPAEPAPVVAPVAPTPAPEPPAEALDGRWARPSPDAPRLMPCAVLDLETLSEVSAEGTHGRAPVRFLHAAITAMDGRGHERQRARWRLVPMSHQRFRVVWYDAATAERLRATGHEVRLGSRHEWARWGGALMRPRFPPPLAAGVYRVRLDVGREHVAALDAERDYDPRFDVVTIARNDHTEPTTRPGRQSISRLAARLMDLAGVEHDAGVEVREVECSTRELTVKLGGHLQRGDEPGVIVAFDGRITVICNAVGAWALRLAEVYGLGGLTAFGFGTVSVKVEAL